MDKTSLISLSLTLCFTQIVGAFETDQFTRRYEYLPDATPILDLMLNKALRDSAKEASGCNVEDLHAKILARLGGFAISTIENWPVGASWARTVSFPTSIYRGLEREKPVISHACCAPTMLVGSTLIGGDKLGHFVQSGYEMFYLVRSRTDHPLRDSRTRLTQLFEWWEEKKNSSFEIDRLVAQYFGPHSEITIDKGDLSDEAVSLVMRASYFQEEHGWGMETSGVKSYADMSANLEGYFFWTQLTDGSNPYFKCVQKKWHLLRNLFIGDYASDAWDEGINCNDYASENFKRTVGEHVEQLLVSSQFKSGACPVDPAKCTRLVRRYGSILPSNLSPQCLAVGTALENGQ